MTLRRRPALLLAALTLAGCGAGRTVVTPEPAPAAQAPPGPGTMGVGPVPADGPNGSAEDEAFRSAEAEAFLDTLQHRTFDWFWDTTNPANGLVPDRWPTPSFSSVAAVGFGLTAYGVGAERGFVARAAAAERTLTTLRFFWDAPQGSAATGVTGYKGFFYHFLDMQTGRRFQTVELSTIDTALLMGGVVFAREYWDRDTPVEAEIRALADSLYQRVEWDWATPRDLVSMAWTPEEGMGQWDYQGYNEAMLLNVLALGSPTFPADESLWSNFTSTYQWGSFYGQDHLNFSPLFGHQYSHAWIDFRGIRDAYMRQKGIDYFENSRRATLSQQAYAADNPNRWRDYSAEIWGLSAVDGPHDLEREVDGVRRRFFTYSARGASVQHVHDDGTLAPTAAGGSIPFAPEIAIPTLRAMAARYGDDLYTRYGFLDSFNPTFLFEDVRPQHGRVIPGKMWVDGDYLGIDQGPIVLMIENHRSGLVWDVMRRSPYVQRGLRRAGFTGGWLDGATARAVAPLPFEPQPGHAGDDRRLIVVLGSSTAAGVGPQHGDSTWVNRFRAHVEAADPRLSVFNLAQPGFTTYQLLPADAPPVEGRPIPDIFRNIDQALRRDPAAIVVNLMSNDRASGFSVADQLANYDVLDRLAREAGVPIYFTTTAPRDLDDAGRADQAALRDSLKARYPGRVIDFWTDIAGPDARLDPRWDSGDHLHLNDAAHGLLFRRVRDAGVLEAARARVGADR
jgi:lysophospholipase L1-like esterase